MDHRGRLSIAQVAPLIESVPPRYYGGTERVVSYLTEELVRQGHEVTLFASGDSRTSARLVAASPRALRLDPSCADPTPHGVLLLERVLQRAAAFDVIHFHIDALHFPLARRLRTPTLTTLHGRLDLTDARPLYREFRELPFVSISDAQRAPAPWLNWQATVHHGLPEDLLAFNDDPEGYLCFLGRASREKRLDRAILIARLAGLRLKVAAKVDEADREYFHSVIEPMLDPGLVEFVGEIGERDKSAFLGGASALLCPFDWPEPFGLAMIEAMGCGTPVIAFRCGSIPEVVEDGLTGFVVDDVEQAVLAVKRARALSRRRVRRRFDERFSVARMADDYLAVYQRLMERRAATRR